MTADMQITLGDAIWRFEAMHHPHGGISTLWVSCVHWPNCCDDGEHGEFGLGVCRDGGSFLVANRWFWDTQGIDYRPVLDAVDRVMATGDLADVSLPNHYTPIEGELH